MIPSALKYSSVMVIDLASDGETVIRKSSTPPARALNPSSTASNAARCILFSYLMGQPDSHHCEVNFMPS